MHFRRTPNYSIRAIDPRFYRANTYSEIPEVRRKISPAPAPAVPEPDFLPCNPIRFSEKSCVMRWRWRTGKSFNSSGVALQCGLPSYSKFASEKKFIFIISNFARAIPILVQCRLLRFREYFCFKCYATKCAWSGWCCVVTRCIVIASRRK